MQIKFTVPGNPKGKARPRMTATAVYTPKETVAYENLVKYCYAMTDPGRQLAGAVKADIRAYFPIPKSTAKRARKRLESGEVRPTKKPDADNIAKIILDSLNQIAYRDDSNIVDLQVSKHYSDIPRVEVSLCEVED